MNYIQGGFDIGSLKLTIEAKFATSKDDFKKIEMPIAPLRKRNSPGGTTKIWFIHG